MDISQEHLERVEKEIVDVLIDRLSSHLTDKEHAGEVAQEVLDRFKTITQDEEIEYILAELMHDYQEIAVVVAKEKDMKEQYAKKMTEKYISQLIKEGKINLATEVMQKTMQGKVQSTVI